MGKFKYPVELTDYDEAVHSDDADLNNHMPQRPTRLPNDANSEMTYGGEGEDRDDGDEDEV